MPCCHARSLLCSVVMIVATGTAVNAQSSSATGPGDQVGLCQCVDDHTSRHLFCTAGTAGCQARCASSHYGFIPLQQHVIARCEPPEIYVVLPSANGKTTIGGITVSHGGNTMLLDRPYAAAGLFSGTAATFATDAGEITPRFQAAIAARPSPGLDRLDRTMR